MEKTNFTVSELVQSFYAASEKTRTCIGVKRAGASQIEFLCNNMDEQREIALRRQDELILINYH